MCFDSSLYLVADVGGMEIGELLQKIERAIKGGCTLVQLREKNSNTKSFYEDANAVKKITDIYQVPLIINDRLDIMLAVGADGVHVGQNDMPAAVARKLIGKRILGVSVHSIREAVRAESEGADYIGVGALFPTDTKKDTQKITIEELKEIVQAVSIPVVAIGGINSENIKELSLSGVSGIAVVSAILNAPQAEYAAKELKREVKQL